MRTNKGGSLFDCWSPEKGSRAELAVWARLVKRVDDVEPMECPACGGAVKIISFIRAETAGGLCHALNQAGGFACRNLQEVSSIGGKVARVEAAKIIKATLECMEDKDRKIVLM